MLHSIVYISTAAWVMSESDLEWLLTESRRLNLQTETTGVLLYDGGVFMQCFEGSEPSIAVTYDRIRCSRRHYGIIELSSEAISARRFSEWTMGFRRTSKSEMLELSTAKWEQQVRGSSDDDTSSGMVHLKHFWSHSTGFD